MSIKYKKIIIITMSILLIISTVVLGVGFGYFKWGFRKVCLESFQKPEWRKNIVITNSEYEKYADKYDIVRTTDHLDGAVKKYYSQYIDYIAPNGKSIRIVAMNKIGVSQMLYCYNMLAFYLANLNDEVANAIANNEAILILPNGADRDGTTPPGAMIGQNLNQMEIAPIGSKWYTNCDYEHRDASFEEIFHMVHDYGIGTTQSPQADKKISESIARAQKNALPADKSKWGYEGLWGLDSRDWLEKLSDEGSIEQEYIVSVIDSYYGLWQAYTESEGGMWGIYLAKTREEIESKDTIGYQTITSFLPEKINSIFNLDDSFEGTFEMTYDEEIEYTSKSQYLTKLMLTGENNININGNNADNLFIPNSATNYINGKGGTNVVQFKGKHSDYTITNDGEWIKIVDKTAGRDGITYIKNIQKLRFLDANKNI